VVIVPLRAMPACAVPSLADSAAAPSVAYYEIARLRADQTGRATM
jgi:hypothetical protein